MYIQEATDRLREQIVSNGDQALALKSTNIYKMLKEVADDKVKEIDAKVKESTDPNEIMANIKIKEGLLIIFDEIDTLILDGLEVSRSVES